MDFLIKLILGIIKIFIGKGEVIDAEAEIGVPDEHLEERSNRLEEYLNSNPESARSDENE